MPPPREPPQSRTRWRFFLPVAIVFTLGTVATSAVFALTSLGASFCALIVGAVLTLSATAHCLLDARRGIREQRLADRWRRELAISEARFHDIFDQAAVGILLADRDGRLLQVNRALERMFGYGPGEMLGATAAGFVEPGASDRVVQLFSELASGARNGYESELRCRRRDGQLLWIRVNATLLEKDGESPHFSIHTVEDITARKQAEEAIRRAKETAETATRAKSEFLTNMSHEIRTPMTAILGFADMLSESCDSPEIRDAVATIQRNGDHLLEIINDVLDLSKIEANRLDIERIPCSPRQIVGEVVAMLRGRAEAKGVTLRSECDGPVPQVILSDPVRLRQIVLNLVGNAVKFTGHGSVRAILRWSAPPDRKPQLQVEVIDTGIGIAPRQLRRLFTPFVQADASAGRRFGGTGLGLVISKRLAGLLGGDISVQSTPGYGSVFTATIDAETPESVSTAAGLQEDFEARSSKTASPPVAKNSLLDCRVLVAEDGADNKRLISLILEKAGATVAVVENGAEAVDCVLGPVHAGEPRGNGGWFDVILMDMQMPVMDGYEATRCLRQAGYTGPIVALTAHAMCNDRQKCLDCGCDEYLSKPIDRDTLVATVARAARMPESSRNSEPARQER